MAATNWTRLLSAAVLLVLVSCDARNQTGAASAHAAHEAAAGEVYTCSMHPQIRLPKPGKCPICQMPLVLAKASAAKSTDSSKNEPMLVLSDHARAMAGVETAEVIKRKLFREIRAVGKVQYNEGTLATITSRVEGYVEKLHVDFTGIAVKPGDHLAEIYSPDLIAAQQELIFAMSGTKNAAAIEGTRLKLLRWGLTEEQVDEVARNQRARQELTLYSPIQGTVIEKNVVLKSMVKPGDVLYRLANLDSVWVYLDIYEYELPWVQYGQMVSITSEAWPGETFTGRVWFINPVLTEESRTVKVLVNISNEARKLKPGMYASASIRVQWLASGKPAPSGLGGKFTCPMHPVVIEDKPGPCRICSMALTMIPGPPGPTVPEAEQLVLAVPATAVLDTGSRKLVYVERAQGEFTPVEISTGPRSGEFFPVLSGLNEGDRVAVRGNFLLDSQFQIAGLPSLFYKEGQAGTAGHQHGGSAPVPTPSPVSNPTGHEGHVPPPETQNK
ncbi:MAG TPA: efflux RND transporter periplasmic adaptor subunit [Candidatus Saccharimonadia bacterium]|nr:efflux RND transporter periplasmic adaptor subunit [Candidatus Saccharimonadia bacterium]